MRELITMWKNTRMVVLVAVSAAAYAAVLIPFKGIVLVPGLTEVRPGAVIPVVFGILFGPAAAWGCGIGNVIADIFGGMFGPGSFFGFLGNLFFAFVAYKLWGALPFISSGQEPAMRNFRQVAEFLVISFISAVAIGGIIGWGVNILGLFPMAVMGIIILVNNSLATLILGPFLLWLLYPRIERWDMLWHEIMPAEDYRPTRFRKLGVILMVAGIFLATGSGVVLSVTAYQEEIVSTAKSIFFSDGTPPGSAENAETESGSPEIQKEAPPNLLAATYGLPKDSNATNTMALLISGLFLLIFLIGCLLA